MAEEFIEWTGGPMPIKIGTPVFTRHRHGKGDKHSLAGEGYATRWSHTGEVDDIVAYRLDRHGDISSPETNVLPIGDSHPDALAVDRFATAMKAKLAKKRAEGRGGWEDKDQCSNALLSRLLVEHVQKGDPVDIGNLAMMIHQRGEAVNVAAGNAAALAQFHAIVDAWEALPGGRQVRNSDVEEWLAEDMAPAIDAIRGFLRRPRPDGVLPAPPQTNVSGREDDFNGDTPHLLRSIDALLRLDADGALVPHGIGGHARTLLSAAAIRLAAPEQRVTGLQAQIEDLESELEEARDVPWPDWASTILKTLKANGYDPVDDAGEVDLGEAFKDYLDGIAQAEEQERKRMTDVFAVGDGGNSITLHFSEIKSARAFRDTFLVGIVTPLPSTKVLALPWELTDDLRDVLSTMLWTSGQIAHCLRAGGEEIKTRAEDEQAYVLHWLLCLALEHGSEWRVKASDRIAEIRATLAATATEGSGDGC